MHTQNLLNNNLPRRAFLGAFALPAFGANRIDRSRVSAITDEIARTPAAAIEFAHQYGLKWLELRSVPGEKREYFILPEAELNQAAKEFRDGGVRISFLNTSMLKFYLPDTTPANPRVRPDPARYHRRKEELRQAIGAAHILGTDKVRIFTFMRADKPEQHYPRIAEVINELAEVAARDKIQLLIENEGACNVRTSAELVALLKMIPSKWVGINWDPHNADRGGEVPFPDGYNLLPARRIHNVQIKGRSILDFPERMDWAAVFKRLEKDGYRDQVGLETHIFGDVQIQKSHESMQAILKVVGA